MKREQLDHVLRAATDIIPGADILIVGSQSVLAVHDEDELPIEATRSIEVDLAFFDDPDDAKADAVDGAIGELSRFHESFGYYAQGVSLTTSILPEGWVTRLVELDAPRTGVRVRALEPHDCVVSKLVANREKDRAFAAALIRAGVVGLSTLLRRVGRLPDAVPMAQRDSIDVWLRRIG